MKNIFKKTIRKKIHQRLDNYIDFQYEKYVIEVKNKSFTKKYQYEIKDLFNKKTKFESELRSTTAFNGIQRSIMVDFLKMEKKDI